MNKENPVVEKSYSFALRIVKMYKYIAETKHEWVLAKQLLKSGTSIGANIEEAIGAQSKPDFIAKLCIARKEARETIYWLRLLKDSEYLEVNQFSSLSSDCEEILKIITSIILTTKQNMEQL